MAPLRGWAPRGFFLAALRHDRIEARPGDIVVMDNLGSHRGKVVRQLIRSTGAKLFFLPKYSPDLKPH